MKKLSLLSMLLCLLTAFSFTSNAQTETFTQCGSTITLSCDGSFTVVLGPNVMIFNLWTGEEEVEQFNNWNPSFPPVPNTYSGTIPADGSGNWWLGFQPCSDIDFNLSDELMGMNCGDDCSECTVLNVTDNDVDICFPLMDAGICAPQAPYYNVGSRVAGTTTWNYAGTVASFSNGTATIFSLDPCTDYEYIVEYKCGNFQSETLDSCIGTFTTTGAGCKTINTDKKALQIHAYPNPAVHSNVTLELPYAEEIYTVSVFDLNGRLLINNQSQGGKTIISTDNLGTGLYILRAENESHQHTEKIQVIK